MIKTRVFVFVVALIASQAWRVYLKDVKTEDRDAKELLKKLQTSTKVEIENAVNKINDLLKDVEDFVDKPVNKAKNSINEAVNVLLDKFDGIKQKAINAGADIDDCIAENENALKNLPKELILNTVTCITDKVKEARKIVTDTVDDVKDTYKKVDDLAKEIDDCEAGILAVVCVAKVAGKISLAIVELPLNIASQVAKASQYVATLQTSLTICAVVQVAKAIIDGGKILAKFSICVVDKVH